MTPDVVAVTARKNFELIVEFADSQIKRFSMLAYLDYPAFRPLKEDNLFMAARVRHGTVAWREDIDISLDTLYREGQACSEEVGNHGARARETAETGVAGGR